MSIPNPDIVLSSLKDFELKSRLENVRHVALDLDGTVYVESTLLPNSLGFLKTLEDRNIGYSFLTNNSSRGTQDYLPHLQKMGLHVDASHVYTSADATIEFLKYEMPEVKTIWLLGTPSLSRQFREHGFTVCDGHEPSSNGSARIEPDAVVLGFDRTLTFDRICQAAWWISCGKPYLATHPDKICPTNEETVLVDCGAVIAALAKATGRKPDVIPGKPDPRMLDGICKRHGIKRSELAMVGDRLYTDIAMAQRAGALSVLVLTGEATAAEAAQMPEMPDLVLCDLGAFGQLLEDILGGRSSC